MVMASTIEENEETNYQRCCKLTPRERGGRDGTGSSAVDGCKQ